MSLNQYNGPTGPRPSIPFSYHEVFFSLPFAVDGEPLLESRPSLFNAFLSGWSRRASPKPRPSNPRPPPLPGPGIFFFFSSPFRVFSGSQQRQRTPPVQFSDSMPQREFASLFRFHRPGTLFRSFHFGGAPLDSTPFLFHMTSTLKDRSPNFSFPSPPLYHVTFLPLRVVSFS